MKKLLFFFLVFTIHITVNAADGFSTLEERMSGKEFKETGLAKLTDEELATLNDWLRRHSIATLENAAARPASDSASAGPTEDLRGFESQSKYNPSASLGDVIHGTIIGKFNGWSGKGSLFRLTNGMVWQQTESDTFYINPVENAEITIERGLLGSWRLSVVGYSSAVRVKRIK